MTRAFLEKRGERMAKIQWYPGHMNRARQELQSKLNLLDVLVEVLDARIPQSSRNPMIEKIVQDKAHLIILNKADLADPVQTKRWQKKLQGSGKLVLALDSLHNNQMQLLVKMIKQAGEKVTARLKKRGANHPELRLAVIGVPNCGKSTIINRLIGKNVTRVANRPGVTKGQTWLKAAGNLQLLDTPGILWPKFEDQEVGYKLAALGAIKDNLFPADDVALFVLQELRQHYLTDLVKFARLPQTKIAHLSNPDLLLAMTKLYGMRDDYDRFALFMLQRLRKGKVGRLTLDWLGK